MISLDMVACLMGANIEKKPDEIKAAIYKSSDRYLSPNDQFGYGSMFNGCEY